MLSSAIPLVSLSQCWFMICSRIFLSLSTFVSWRF
jgi:hypothetical protein